ncbi:hypothetical protein [Dysgonomonas macrotermitis]|uniref:C1q domain-containing protein n=1 Tax=Dysgonomonas macrotermitis TaxID=1346286 RepID=A0A1M5JUH6_9BACT|nr:hypothetical protein [Dysgonomonas macrotermitis]SHG44204.1 hypothetical protein SAMN05444362_1293 [Dysgonomonas macrotermitis]
MKYIYFTICTLWLSCGLLWAQIGINTNYPISNALLHIDGLSNNTNNVPSELVDDMVAALDNAGSISLGLGKKAAENAQVDLGSNNHALKMNEVRLTSLTDIITVPDPRAGMVVYNTVAIASEEVEIGWYYFDGIKWRKIQKAVKDPNLKNEFSIPNGVSDTAEIPAISLADASSNIYSGATKLAFVNTETSQIIAPTDGTYVFALRLYFFSTFNNNISIPSIIYDNQAVLHIFLTSKTKNKVLDKALITFPFNQRTRRYYSYRLVMGTTLDKDEEVELYIGRGLSPEFDDCPLNIRIQDSSDPSVKAAARVSLVFWKL